jgi:hypothetical protein
VLGALGILGCRLLSVAAIAVMLTIPKFCICACDISAIEMQILVRPLGDLEGELNRIFSTLAA